MSDYINRRAAIDAVNGMPDCPNGYSDTYDKAHIIAVLEDVPAVQTDMSGDMSGTHKPLDCISRQAAIDALHMHLMYRMGTDSNKKRLDEWINNLPPAQPEIIRCRECKFASGDSRICMQFGHSPIGELDFCAWAERRTDG